MILRNSYRRWGRSCSEALAQEVHSSIPIRSSGRKLAEPQYAAAAGIRLGPSQTKQEEGAHGGVGDRQGQSESGSGEDPGQARGRCHQVCWHAGSGNLESSGRRRCRRNCSLDGDRPAPPPLCLDHGHRISDGVVPRLLPLLSSAHSVRTQSASSRLAIPRNLRSASTRSSSRNTASGWIALRTGFS